MNQAKQNILRTARAALEEVRQARLELEVAEAQLVKACAALQWESADYGRVSIPFSYELSEKASRTCMRLSTQVMQAYLETNPE